MERREKRLTERQRKTGWLKDGQTEAGRGLDIFGDKCFQLPKLPKQKIQSMFKP